MNIIETLLVISVFMVVYAYIIYPLILMILRRFIYFKEPSALSDFPLVSVIVSAYNEEKVIEKKIQNTLNLDYPESRLEILIGSDGSNDHTDEICCKYPRVKLYRIESRKGKANVLNTLIPRASGEIILLSDANTIIEKSALIVMLRHFVDPTIGGVCGRLVLTSNCNRLENTEKIYWRCESRLKELESDCYSTIGANGGIYAIRKDIFKALPTNTIIDDFLISLNLLEQNKRLVFERNAVAYEEVCQSFRDEFRRKVRIGAGNLQVLLNKLTFFFKVPPFLAFAFLSHKIIRWLVPIALLSIWICCLVLSERQLFGILFGIYNITILLGLAGILGKSTNRIVMAFAYLYSINFALLIGYCRYIFGIQKVTWRKAQR